MSLQRSAGDAPGAWLLIEAAAFILLAEIAIRVVGFSLLVRTVRSCRKAKVSPLLARRIGQAVELTGSFLRLTCLRRAFAAAWMLQARGASPKLHYGVAKQGEATVAHAWLELEGTPVVGTVKAGGFTLLATFPAPQHARKQCNDIPM